MPRDERQDEGDESSILLSKHEPSSVTTTRHCTVQSGHGETAIQLIGFGFCPERLACDQPCVARDEWRPPTVQDWDDCSEAGQCRTDYGQMLGTRGSGLRARDSG